MKLPTAYTCGSNSVRGVRTKQLTFFFKTEVKKLLICILQIHVKLGDFENHLQLLAVKHYYCTEEKKKHIKKKYDL